MTTTATPLAPPSGAARQDLVRTARATGLLYLGVALTGGLAFLGIRGQIFVDGDPAATFAHLVDNEALARAGVVLEVGLVLTQVLCALWFFRLFRSVDAFAAGCIAVFGAINAVAIMVSAALLGTALEVAGGALDDPESAAETVQLLYLVSGNMWSVGGLFFGLWLIPMGWLVRRSGWMPSAMGWILMVGGVGYILGAFVTFASPSPGAAADILAMPSAVGELWMVGYLIIVGVRRPA
jgi:hypothetical protein